MGAIQKSKIGLVKKLYNQDLHSAREIAKKLSVSIDAVYYFMRRHKIERRNLSEQNRLVFARKKPSFQLKRRLSPYERELKTIGVILYWGEGYKAESSDGIDFANSDPKMVATFVHFLRLVCGVDESRLRAFVYCYDNQNITELQYYWSKLTGIPKSQFTKPYVRKDFRIDKKGRMPYGLVHIRYSDKKLLCLLMEWIERSKDKFCVGGRVVNYTSL